MPSGEKGVKLGHTQLVDGAAARLLGEGGALAGRVLVLVAPENRRREAVALGTTVQQRL